MTHIGQRPRAPGQECRAAADEQAQNSTPDDAAALEALRTLRAWLQIQTNRATALYDQRDGHRPPDAVSADAYMRRHRQLRRAGVPGAYVRGKLLVCTAEAWASDLPKATAKPKLTVVPAADALDEALGIRTKAVRR